METSSRELNIKYAFVQAGYWMGFCVAFSFGAVMLQARGCSNAELGGIMAAGNICGFILSPMLAERLDSSKRLTVYHALWALQLFELVLLAAFALIPGHGTAVAVIYTLYIAIEVCINPVNTQLYNLMELRGIHINYGLARGIGSLAFAAISAVLGILAGSLGAASLPVAGLVLCLFRCAALLAIQLRLRHGGNSDALSEDGDKRENSRSLVAFLRYNPRFCGLLLGVALLFFGHNTVTNFMINVVRSVGGNETSMGLLNAFMAATEIPIMFLYDRLTRRVKCPATLRFAGIMFSVKAAAFVLAPNMLGLYGACALQSLSFALLIPASVRYVNLYIAPADCAKGQALIAGMTSLGSIFASFVGGMLYDMTSVKITLLVGFAAATAGAVLCQIGTVRE